MAVVRPPSATRHKETMATEGGKIKVPPQSGRQHAESSLRLASTGECIYLYKHR